MSYRFVNPAPLWFNAPGTEPLSGGSWTFYEPGSLSILKDTYSDPELANPNPNPIPLDAFGRLQFDVFLDGDYSAVLKDSQGAAQTTKDITSGIPSGFNIPPLVAGAFLTNDASNLIWEEILQVPDPTGSANYILSTDGSNIFWTPKPAETPPITNTTGSFKIGSLLVQMGNDAFPIPVVLPHHGATKAVVFPIAFDACTGVVCMSNHNQIAVSGFLAILSAEYTPTGFTAEFNTNENSLDPNAEVNISVPFSWIAWGTKA